MIELRTLGYFATACRCATLAQAAKKLGIALSTLSATLKALEGDVGFPLFRRTHYGLYPTAGARRLMRAAEPLLDCEAFARRWIGAARARDSHILTVETGQNFAIGGIGDAIERAIATLATERPNVIVDPIWTRDKGTHDKGIHDKGMPRIDGLARAWPKRSGDSPAHDRGADSRLVIGLALKHERGHTGAVTLHRDSWVFACRLPAGTIKPPAPADLARGRLLVPALAPPLIEQAKRYLTQNGITNVRYVNEHPDELPRLLDDNPDAVLFVPESLISRRLGFLRVKAVAAEPSLTMRIVAQAATPTPATTVFVRHLRRAFAGPPHPRARKPAISLRQIQYFEAVYRTRGISSAAHGANVSQPALSEQLHKLERALGARLFERRGDGVIPTENGDRFADIATVIKDGFRRIVDGDAGAATAPPNRRIAVGIMPSVSQHGHLVNRIAESVLDVQTRHPALRLVVREAPNGTLQDWVMRGLVGVAIVETGLPHMPRLPLGSSEDLAVIAHARHALLPPGPVKFAELPRLALALPTKRYGLRQLIEAAAEERGLRIQPDMEIDALTMVVAMLARAPICTILPPSAIERELSTGDLVAHPIVDPVIARRLFVIYSGDRSLSEPERDLVTTLRNRLSASRKDR